MGLPHERHGGWSRTVGAAKGTRPRDYSSGSELGGPWLAGFRCMDFNVWRRHYLENKRNRPEPRWDAPQTLDGPTRFELARSLAHFQLGESGDGATFLRWARERAPGPGFGEAAALFIAGETEHARLVKHLVLRFGGELVASHSTHSGCKRLR